MFSSLFNNCCLPYDLILTACRSIECKRTIQLSCLHKLDLSDYSQSIVCFRSAKQFRVKFSDSYHLVSFAQPPYYRICAQHFALYDNFVCFVFFFYSLSWTNFVSFVFLFSFGFLLSRRSPSSLPCDNFVFILLLFRFNRVHVVCIPTVFSSKVNVYFDFAKIKKFTGNVTLFFSRLRSIAHHNTTTKTITKPFALPHTKQSEMMAKVQIGTKSLFFFYSLIQHQRNVHSFYCTREIRQTPRCFRFFSCVEFFCFVLFYFSIDFLLWFYDWFLTLFFILSLLLCFSFTFFSCLHIQCNRCDTSIQKLSPQQQTLDQRKT